MQQKKEFNPKGKLKKRTISFAGSSQPLENLRLNKKFSDTLSLNIVVENEKLQTFP